ncbi:unnamed protein product [Echinostoma caproni]|uniref:Rab-GAP TBC domain-containing protein n=1 Tax=Echinostoma caproni TaxID=27848 RepID=A0A183AG77_9TREM|nr:unnamed protein product [Echinostoma caproni]
MHACLEFSGPQLHNLLAAYVAYQPHIGYIPGMSHLAALLLLVVPDPFDSFVLFANILDTPCHRAFYNPNESEFVVYFRAFDHLLADRMPHLHSHFTRVGLEPNMYLFDWLFTIFSRTLPLEAALRVWDVYSAEGDIILFRVALTLLHHFQRDLMQLSFDKLIAFLTSRLPLDLTGDQLMKHVYAIRLKRSTWERYLHNSRPGHKSRKLHHGHIFTHHHSVSHVLNSTDPTICRNSFADGANGSINLDALPDPNKFHPGLVDHSTRSLYSPSSTTSEGVPEDDLEPHAERTDTIPPSAGDWALDWDLGPKTPWTVDLHPSPFNSAVFTFDEDIPFSAPPNVPHRTPGHRKFSRWASEWALSDFGGDSATSRWRTGNGNGKDRITKNVGESIDSEGKITGTGFIRKDQIAVATVLCRTKFPAEQADHCVVPAIDRFNCEHVLILTAPRLECYTVIGIVHEFCRHSGVMAL